MSELTLTLVTVAGLFVVFLTLKTWLRFIFCALCLAVSTTWLIGLGAIWANRFDDQLIVGLLMGQSIVGVYYLVEQRVAAPWLIFRLPALLTATVLAYSAIRQRLEPAALALLAVLWLVCGAVYLLRQRPAWQRSAQLLIACCRNW